MLPTILLVAAFILFALAAFGVKSERINPTAGGLALWTLSQIVAAYPL